MEKNYSFADYKKLFSEEINKGHFSGVTSLSDPYLERPSTLSVVAEQDLGGNSLENELQKYKSLILQVHQETVELLKKDKLNNSVQVFLNFPEEVSVYCKQYLEYFVQFLSDICINATSNIEEEAGKVLFSVTPTDDTEALYRIREALAVYLNLPSSSVIYSESFAAVRLQQQVENLQHSQKMVARELQITEKLLHAQSQTILEKNLLISQKDSVIGQQNQIIEKILNKSVMIDSVENKEQLEEIFEGFKIGESKFLKEQLGIHLNPAKAIKTIGKKILGEQNDNLSILDTGENENKEN